MSRILALVSREKDMRQGAALLLCFFLFFAAIGRSLGRTEAAPAGAARSSTTAPPPAGATTTGDDDGIGDVSGKMYKVQGKVHGDGAQATVTLHGNGGRLSVTPSVSGRFEL